MLKRFLIYLLKRAILCSRASVTRLTDLLHVVPSL